MALIRCAIMLLLMTTAAVADDQRAHVNYMLHCQGCHLPDAAGHEGKVPPMKDFVGYFLHSEEGRDFLIRVPGVAHAALNDEELTELMNWLLLSFSEEQLPTGFTPFTESEVNRLRADPENRPDSVREEILADIARDVPSLQPALLDH